MGCIITGNAFSGTQLNDLIIRLINTSVIYNILDLGYRRPQTKYLFSQNHGMVHEHEKSIYTPIIPK